MRTTVADRASGFRVSANLNVIAKVNRPAAGELPWPAVLSGGLGVAVEAHVWKVGIWARSTHRPARHIFEAD